MADSNNSISIASESDVAYVVHLQKVWSNQLGFLPKPALQRYIDNKATLLVQLNGQHAGYLNWQLTKKGLLRIVQIAIEPELLRGRLGTETMAYIEAAAKRGSCSVIRLCTRADIAATLFFREQHFQTTAIFERPTARRQRIIEWTKCLIDPLKLTDNLVTRKRKRLRQQQFAQPHVAHSRQVQATI